ncbi:tail protein [Burkholderia phage Mica]|uniref:Tape measure chaperone n=1 Tax=Burkholderia phage Mica TaxID=2767579 RepID=A0A873WKN9_9CAUD|nr:tail protein [Burkholderia phage Mica]QPB08635.1 tape measure chaperone [Burkholderia phage Mica]
MSGEKKPAWMKVNEDGSVTVTLSRPIEVNGAKLAAMTMREPEVGDQLAANEVKGSEDIKEVHFFANLCTIAPEDVRRLKVRDYQRLQLAFANFTD